MNLGTVVKKRRAPWLLAPLLITWFGASCLYAAFEETAVGGRPAGLGGIYVSACDDVNSIYHNPAGLALLPRAEFTAQYSKLQIGLTDSSDLGYSFVGIAQPLGLKYGTLGLGWLRFELSGLYNEDTLIVSYAKDATFIKRPWAKNLNLGVNLKYLRLGYGEDKYTLNALDNNGNATGFQDSLFAVYGRTKSNIDIDLGAQYRLGYNYKVGFMIENLTEPNLALQKDVSAPLYRAYKMGITYSGRTFMAVVDWMFKNYNGGTDWEVSPAGEKRVSDSVALRGALNIGSRNLVKVACGIGYKIDAFQVDYALVYPLSGVKGTMGDHRISVLFRFGKVIRAPEKAEEIIAKYDEERQAHIATKKKLQEAKTELEKLRRDIEEQLSRPEPVVPVVAKPVKAEPVVAAPLKVSPAVVPAEKPGVKALTQTTTPAVAVQASAGAAAEYAKEFGRYRRVAANMSIPQRLAMVEAITKKYGSLTNISEAEQERKTLSGEQKAQSKYFKDSLEYYRNMAKYGIKKEERMDILKRMIKKYEAMGIDVSEAQAEMDKIQGK